MIFRLLLRLLQKTILRPNYSLRFQLWLSFGSTAAVAIIVICASAIVLALKAGGIVDNMARETLQNEVATLIQSSSLFLATTLSEKIANLGTALSILSSVSEDRLYESRVPFYDSEGQKWRYPLKDFEAPLDWEVQGTVNASNVLEHLQQERAGWYDLDSNLTTGAAKFRSQVYGNEGFLNYTLPGVNDTQLLRQKVSSIQYVLKPLFESHVDIKNIGVYFKNSGYGASIVFPARSQFTVGIPPESFYESRGCDWMTAINHHTGRPFGTAVEIARCHPSGTNVPVHEYNPLERQWCADQALKEGGHDITGPYKDAFQEDLWLLTFGKAVFAPDTGEFLACTLADVSIGRINEILTNLISNMNNERVRSHGNDIVSDIALVRWDSGAVVTSVRWDTADIPQQTSVNDLPFVDNNTFYALRDLIHPPDNNTAAEYDVLGAYNKYVLDQTDTMEVVAAYPIPLPPPKYDPDYVPNGMLFVSVGDSVFDAVRGIGKDINESTIGAAKSASGAVIVGLVLDLCLTALISYFLTRPLRWIQQRSEELVNAKADNRILDGNTNEDGGPDTDRYRPNDQTDGPKLSVAQSAPLMTCTPKTEIFSLVQEFHAMVEEPSGAGPASVARPALYEIRNVMGWYRELDYFRQIGSGNESGNPAPVPEGEVSSSDEDDTDTEHEQKNVRIRPEQKSESTPPLPSSSPSSESESPSTSVSLSESILSLSPPIGAGFEKDNDEERTDEGSRRRKSLIRDQALTVDDEQPRPLHATLHRSSLRSSMLLDLDLDETESSTTAEHQDSEGNEHVEQLSNRQTIRKEKTAAAFLSARVLAKKMESNLPDRLHRGNNISPEYGERKKLGQAELQNTLQVGQSRLFWWIVTLLVLPLTAMIVTVSWGFYNRVILRFPELLHPTQIASLRILETGVVNGARSGALLATETLMEPARNIHLYRRFAEWLLFGVIELAPGFTETLEFTEECKHYPSDGSCPALADKTRTPCDCAWNDVNVGASSCRVFERNESSRHLQRRFFSSERSDADPVTGERQNTSYPNVAFWPNSTYWWDNETVTPGASTGDMSSTTGADNTTFNRLRALSAMAVVDFSLYHYSGVTDRTKPLGMYVGLEADGTLTGYAGCDFSFPQLSHFQSNAQNRAASIRPDLCPEGKYGYDARCRDWYANGRKTGAVRLIAPYRFAITDTVAMGITAPIIDTRTGEQVAQALMDFFPQPIFGDQQTTGMLPVIVTPDKDINGGDTIAAPNYSLGDTSPDIVDVLFPHDAENSTNRRYFEETVLRSMKSGEFGWRRFERNREDGTPEAMLIAFDRVAVRDTRPINSRNFGAGVNVSEALLYSWGLLVANNEMGQDIRNLDKDALDRVLRIFPTFIGIMIAVEVFVVLMTVLVRPRSHSPR